MGSVVGWRMWSMPNSDAVFAWNSSASSRLLHSLRLLLAAMHIQLIFCPSHLISHKVDKCASFTEGLAWFRGISMYPVSCSLCPLLFSMSAF